MGCQVQVEGRSHPKLKRVYYTDDDTLREGDVVIYNKTPAVEGDPYADFGAVKKPVTADLKLVAGVVAGSANGVTGPAWIDIHPLVAGDTVNVRVAGAIAAGAGLIAANGVLNAVAKATPTGSIEEIGIVPVAATGAGLVKCICR